MTRVTILWCQWSGYMDASARALALETGWSLDIVSIPPETNAPFSESEFFNYPCRSFSHTPGKSDLPAQITDNPPDILLVCGWHVPAYRALSQRFKGKSTRVLCMDNQWLGTLKQYLGALASPFMVRPHYDLAFVPGPRQAEFARRLGFATDKIYQGHYACDYDRFSVRYDMRKARPLSRSFMFVGRLVAVKGLDVLMNAWAASKAHAAGWSLKLVGGGSYDHPGGVPAGVEFLGFSQPSALPDKFLEGDVFVLPSTYEPWGLVVHEAAATGMPMICSDACGAGDAFVRNGENGFIVAKGDAAALAAAFDRISALDEAGVRAMGAKSFALSGTRTPSTWAGQVQAMAQAGARYRQTG